MSIAGAPVYHDLQGLSTLRHRAGNNPAEAIEEVATQFESLFVQMMLKAMRDATIEGGLFESDQMEHYQSMFDQQISLDLAGKGGLGLSDILEEQLGGGAPMVGVESATEPVVAFLDVHENAKRQMLNLYSAAQHEPITVKGVGIGNVGLEPLSNDAHWRPSSPEEFIRGVWEHAVDAARELGLDPEVLVAQSALETGWGKQLIPAAGGHSSFNLFGVKAGGNWDGESAVTNTLEFRDGLAVQEKASFRVYNSLAGSFTDYVEFLKGNPRYRQALENTGDSQQFLLELQHAGYATDPRYAEKIMGIVNRNTYSSVINELKNSPVQPLSS